MADHKHHSASAMRQGGSEKGTRKSGERPPPPAARPRRPQARKAGSPETKPTAPQCASPHSGPFPTCHPGACRGCWGAAARVYAHSNRARHASHGAHGASHGRTNGRQATADTVRDALARCHHTTWRKIRRERLHRHAHSAAARPYSPFRPHSDPHPPQQLSQHQKRFFRRARFRPVGVDTNHTFAGHIPPQRRES